MLYQFYQQSQYIIASDIWQVITNEWELIKLTENEMLYSQNSWSLEVAR